MRTQATHRGTCQLCGHDQKLPGDKLSLHGYTVRWGFFSGTCPGSRELPYELSADLISGEIVKQKSAIVRLKNRAAEIRSDKVKAIVSERVRSPGYTSTIVTREISAEDFILVNPKYTRSSVSWLGSEGKRIESSFYVETIAEAIAKFNESAAVTIDGEIANRKTYISWLTERVAAWTLKPLVEIPAEERGTKAPIIHGGPGYYGGAFCAASAMGSRRLSNWTKNWNIVTCAKCVTRHDEAIARRVAKEKAAA